MSELLEVQKENLSVQKEQLKIKQQKLEFDRLVASNIVQLVPILNNFMKVFSKESSRKRKHISDDEDEDEEDDLVKNVLKTSKMLHSRLETGMKKFILDDEKDESDIEHDSGIHNDDISISSDK